jgi:nucleotide-binding universal stress UspA family protein
MFEKILLPLDGSHSCLRARELAAVIAKKFGSKVTAIHVISRDFHAIGTERNLRTLELMMEELDKTYQKAGEKILRAATEFFNEEGLVIDTLLENAADPADRILQKAEELRSDVIIMGNISEEQSRRYALGSIAEKISFHSQCPVLIAKRKTKIGRLLVAFDSSEQAREALKYAVNLCKHFKGASMTVLNVESGELHRLNPKLSQAVGEQILDKATTSIEGVTCDTRLEFGKPANMILKIAKIDNYDLIVLGKRGLSSIKRFLIGSVTADVSMRSERSVLIVH